MRIRTSQPSLYRRRQQQGIALLLAISIILIGVIASTTLIAQQQLSLRKSSNLIIRNQAAEYNLAAENWAKIWLTKDAEESEFDAATENWATELPPLPIDGGVIVARLYDLQGRLNINSLVSGRDAIVPDPNRDPDLPIPPTPMEQQQQLFRALTEANLAPRLEDVIDWIDEDNSPTESIGAEGNHYFSLERPHRPANQEALSVSELRLMRDVDDEVYRSYRAEDQPFEDPRIAFTALPGYTKININLAPQSLFVALGINEIEAQAVYEEIQETPFEVLADIDGLASQYGAKIGDTAGPDVDYIIDDVFTVKSDFFLLVSKTYIGRSQSVLYSTIYRDRQNRCHVINRSYGTI